MRNLLIDTITIKTLTPVNSGGDVTYTQTSLYTDIKGRISELTYRDRKFVESKEQYSHVIKKCFVMGNYTGIKDGMLVSHESVTYRVDHVKTSKDSAGIHHFELYLSDNEPA